MDTSETFIKMCEKAKKIQERHSFEFDDLCYLPRHEPAKVVVQLQNTNANTRQVKVWLPRQDQLQKMVSKYDLPNLLVEFYCFVSGRIPKTNEVVSKPLWNKFTSMEQLWLAFHMKEEYNKTWNGSEWIST